MSHSEYQLKIRLPKVLENHLRYIATTYEMSLNDTVKMVLSQHHLEHVVTHLTPPSDVTRDTKKKVKVTPPNDVTHDTTPKTKPKSKVTPPSDVKGDTKPYIYNIIYNDIFKIIDNNILCTDPTLEEAWKQFQRFRKEKKKKIVPSQLDYIARQFDKVIQAEGIKGLIDRLNRSVANGWIGFVFPNEELGKSEPTNREFTEDDI